VKHLLVTVAAATSLAVGVIGVLAPSSSAQSSHKPRTITLTLVPTGAGFFLPPGSPKPGTRLGSVQTVRGDDGSKGSADVLCTFIKAPQVQFCDLQFHLSTGLLSLQGIAHQPNKNEPFTVTGGTGAYAVGRGSARVTDVSDSTTSVTVKLP
jgi:hypothetical protein